MGLLKELFADSLDAGGVHADVLLPPDAGVRRLSTTFDDHSDWSKPAHPDPSDDGAGSADTIAADPDVEAVLEVTKKAFAQLAERARQELDDAVRSAPDQHEAIRRALSVVEKYQPELSQALAVAQLAALLVGMRKVAESVPQDAGAMPRPENIPSPQITEQVIAVGQTPAGLVVATEPVHADLPEVAEALRLPLIEEAVQALASRRLLTHSEYESLADTAKVRALTVAGVESEATLAKVRDALTEAVREGLTLDDFAKKLQGTVETGTMFSKGITERVFRTGVMMAYAEGQEKLADHPTVVDAFPFVETNPIRDSRLTHLCDVISRSGLDGTGIFWRDDPTWQKFKNPKHWACRCGTTYLTVEQAARKGVRAAQRWLETGRKPEMEFVPPPPVELPRGWSHGLLALSLARLREG